MSKAFKSLLDTDCTFKALQLLVSQCEEFAKLSGRTKISLEDFLHRNEFLAEEMHELMTAKDISGVIDAAVDFAWFVCEGHYLLDLEGYTDTRRWLEEVPMEYDSEPRGLAPPFLGFGGKPIVEYFAGELSLSKTTLEHILGNAQDAAKYATLRKLGLSVFSSGMLPVNLDIIKLDLASIMAQAFMSPSYSGSEKEFVERVKERHMAILCALLMSANMLIKLLSPKRGKTITDAINIVSKSNMSKFTPVGHTALDTILLDKDNDLVPVIIDNMVVLYRNDTKKVVKGPLFQKPDWSILF